MISEAERHIGRITRLERRLDRERRARQEAETLLEARALELYNANCHLTALARDLETRVLDRTRELDFSRRQALFLAERDPLTALANRVSFARDLDRAINSASDEKRSVHLLLIDLDRFKEVNDITVIPSEMRSCARWRNACGRRAEKSRPSAGWAETSLLSSAVRYFTWNAGPRSRWPSPRPWKNPSIITSNSFPSPARWALRAFLRPPPIRPTCSVSPMLPCIAPRRRGVRCGWHLTRRWQPNSEPPRPRGGSAERSHRW
jgi:diguanylate cyclase with GGDEF domain